MIKALLIQLIGAVGYLLLSASYHRKSKKEILIIQIFAYLIFAVHFYLLNGISGAINNLVGFVGLIAMYLLDNKKKSTKIAACSIFSIIVIIINIISFQNIFSIFPMIALIIVIVSFVEDSEGFIRIAGLTSSACWLVYAIRYKSYISMLFQVIVIVNAFTSLFKKNKKDT